MRSINKKLLSGLLFTLKKGTATVTYPDGETRLYGKGKPDFEINLKTDNAVRAILRNPSLGFAEGYINGDISLDGDLVQAVQFLLQNDKLVKKIYSGRRLPVDKKLHKTYVESSYDKGRDFFTRILGKTLLYSCAVHKSKEDSLDVAQQYKTEHILKLLDLKLGQRLLDIGSGWGYMSVLAAKQYGVKVTGLTLSSQQLLYARKLAKQSKVDHLVEFKLLNFIDFDPTDRYDAILSIECLESIGKKYLFEYIENMAGLLKPGGKICLQSCIMTTKKGLSEPFLDKYVFNGVYVPSESEVIKLLKKTKLNVDLREDILSDYELTTSFWLSNLTTNKNWVINNYGEKFYKIYELYLSGMVATARYHGDLTTLRWLIS